MQKLIKTKGDEKIRISKYVFIFEANTSLGSKIDAWIKKIKSLRKKINMPIRIESEKFLIKFSNILFWLFSPNALEIIEVVPILKNAKDQKIKLKNTEHTETAAIPVEELSWPIIKVSTMPTKGIEMFANAIGSARRKISESFDIYRLSHRASVFATNLE